MPFLRCADIEVLLAISDSEVIVTTKTRVGKKIQIYNVEAPETGVGEWLEVQTWINLLRRDDGGVGAR